MAAPIYSISMGTEEGGYYGARRNKDNLVELMKNNAATGGKSNTIKSRGHDCRRNLQQTQMSSTRAHVHGQKQQKRTAKRLFPI